MILDIFESYFQTLDLTFDIIIILMVGIKIIKTKARDINSFRPNCLR